jgi:hypothetical protein
MLVCAGNHKNAYSTAHKLYIKEGLFRWELPDPKQEIYQRNEIPQVIPAPPE